MVRLIKAVDQEEDHYLCKCNHDVSEHGMGQTGTGDSYMKGCRAKNCECGRFLFKFPEISTENASKETENSQK